MRYFNYFISWTASVFGVSLFYYIFWDTFYAAYYQELGDLVYGFQPAGLPPLNWKINALIWLSGIILMAVFLGLIMDVVCKSQYKCRRKMPIYVILVNQAVGVVLYVLLGRMLGYYDGFYYMCRFFAEILAEACGFGYYHFQTADWMMIIMTFHALLFAVLSMWFYFPERKKQEYWLVREKEYKKELEERNER